MANWGDLYLDHYEQYFGHLFGGSAFDPSNGGPSVQALRFHLHSDDGDALTTLGLTHYADLIEVWLEAFTVVQEWDDALPFAFTLPILNALGKTPLRPGTCLNGVDQVAPTFAANYGMSALYLTTPFLLDQDAQHIKFGQKQGFLLLGIFLKPEEAAFAQQYGSDALETQLENSDVEPFNLQRASCV